jgi:hypothetical protein
MDLYIHSPIRLHGLVLNYLGTGTTLPSLPSLLYGSEHRTLEMAKNRLKQQK